MLTITRECPDYPECWSVRNANGLVLVYAGSWIEAWFWLSEHCQWLRTVEPSPARTPDAVRRNEFGLTIKAVMPIMYTNTCFPD